MTNESVSRTDIENFCQNHTQYATFFPIVLTFFGFLIAVLYMSWFNYNHGKFDIFFTLANDMKSTKNEKSGKYEGKNDIIVQTLIKTFSECNQMYYSYFMMKVLQAISALAAIIIISTYLSSLNQSTLLAVFGITNEVPIFYCQLDQLEQFNSSFSSQVPCTDITSRTTALISFIDLVLLSVILILSIASMFTLHPKELKHRQAAKFSFNTGISHRHYPSKLFDIKGFNSDLDFLIVMLRRIDFGRADVIWEMRTLEEITLLNNDDHMRSTLNYEQQKLDPIYRQTQGLYHKITQVVTDV